MDVNDSPRILITRLSHIGDCVLTLPVVAAIRKKFPNAFIAWAVESPSHKLLELHPGIDEIVMIPKSWMSKPKNWFQLSKKLKEYKFDIAIDPQGITKSAMLGRLSGAKKRIGAKGRWGRELSTTLNNQLIEPKSTHVVERSLEILDLIGINSAAVDTPNIEMPICQTSLASVKTELAGLSLVTEIGPQHGFVMINPGGSWASKRWEMDRFGAVASYLKRHHGLTSVVVWAGDEEREMAQVIHDFDPTASVIAPSTSLTELAALASLSSFFIGGDTGPMHIASSVGTPCIGLYGTTQPNESGAYGSQHIAVQKWYQSGSCRKRRTADNDAMRDILAADVFSACDEMIDRLKLSKNRAA